MRYQKKIDLRSLIAFVLLFVFVGCKQKKPVQEFKNTIDLKYTLNENYDYSDVRRYGLFPDKPVGSNPLNGKTIMNSVLDVAELGVPLKFPRGNYLTSLKIIDRSDIELNFDGAVFFGTIEVQRSQGVSLLGTLTSLEQFYSRDSKKVQIGQIEIKRDTVRSLNKRRPYGCSIHSGTHNLTIRKLIVDDVGSGTSDFKYVKGGLVVHGHNDEPENIKMDSVFIKSSDRHGVYLSGDQIHIDYLSIDKFGIGSGEHMAKMEGGIEGEQLDFAGLWIKNCFDSSIKRTEINLTQSKGVYSLNMDYGESFRPVILDTVLLIGKGKENPLIEKYSPRTGVKINLLKHLNE